MNESIEKLLTKFLTNNANREELIQLERWIKDDENQTLFSKYIKVNTVINKTMNNTNKQQAKEDIRRRIMQKKHQGNNWNNFFKYAAVVALAFGLGYLFNTVKPPNSVPTEEPIVSNKQIEAGTDKATLTLEDCSQVALVQGKTYTTQNAISNGEELVYNTETSKEAAYNYLTVPRGGQFFVQLSDSTKVWLNSDSQIKYPVTFIKGHTRVVELVYGEAYFDVSPSTNHHGSKFKVLNGVHEVEVLGTEFNIKAYEDETYIYTTLVEGKVAVGDGFKEKRLIPNQQSIFHTKTKTLLIKPVDVYNEISWKEGIFSFESKSLKEITVVLSRWYDIDFVFENKTLENEYFIGVLGKDQHIEEILSIIKDFGIIKNYEINDNEIILK